MEYNFNNLFSSSRCCVQVDNHLLDTDFRKFTTIDPAIANRQFANHRQHQSNRALVSLTRTNELLFSRTPPSTCLSLPHNESGNVAFISTLFISKFQIFLHHHLSDTANKIDRFTSERIYYELCTMHHHFRHFHLGLLRRPAR